MYCINCGTQNDDSNTTCCKCGHTLDVIPASGFTKEAPIMGGLIPRNTRALIAYYSGIFSLIPCFALVLGPVAFVAGILGVLFANKHPEAKGKVHAWIGIIIGGICFLINFLFFIISLVGILFAPQHTP